ncbi:MAG TPA: hypothetical protein PK669_10455 [Methanosarcina thermophila]|jgi:hypothetical protein|nr:hypothetical protein [Methanosarcina thermophila]HOA69729.1 hypothetical protein [Methanosarcina thermophila]HOQ66223.1 hypothetical protein [Methanosarcina thermophila]HPT81392.1 hypothetical protein [Methanosarcina thermophila]HPZ20884.1 hypothetical protein [Methanosarcina thermophila]HQD95099.1 hypothetical protein [Methanosarcina thermophila]
MPTRAFKRDPVITDEKGVSLDGNHDGKAGGDFEYRFNVMR